MTVLEELEQIDDDCDKHGIQFVKIDDPRSMKEFGISSVRTTESTTISSKIKCVFSFSVIFSLIDPGDRLL